MMDVVRLSLELTNRCNLKCPMCFQSTKPLGVKKDFNINWLDKLPMENMKFIDLCGNVSEPTCHPQLFNIIDKVHKRTMIKISTNGSMHKESWWSELAKKLNEHRDCYVLFALDGLEESHKKYRIGTNYKQMLKNIKAFNDAGGESYSQMIVFKHSQDEVEDVKKVSESLGCKDLLVRTSSFYENEFEKPDNIRKTRHEACADANMRVKCAVHLEIQSIFIDFEGYVFPCCLIAGSKYSHAHPEARQLYLDNSDSININDHTIEEIFESNYYTYLHNNFKEIDRCQSFCKFEDKDFMEVL